MTPTNGYPIDPDKLRAARLAAGLTVVQLGQQSKTVTARVVSYEAGESTPTITTLHRLAATLDVAPTELMAPRGDGPLTFIELRARAGITQPEIAAQLGLPSPVHYSHLEIGQSPLTTAHQLADLLEVPVTDIAAAYATARRHRQQVGV